MNTISIILPTFNEEVYLEDCLASVRRLLLPDGWEIAQILVVDGGSVDSTLRILDEIRALDSRVTVLNNPGRFQAAAINIGLRASIGNYILRLDAHAVYPQDYLQKCVEVSLRTKAENVGGVVITAPGANTFSAALVQSLTTHRFGVGNSGFRLGAVDGQADTVPYGFFRRDVFESIGYFDERLVRGEDYEFNRRIILAGGVVWRSSGIQALYYNKKSIFAFLKKQLIAEAPYNAYLWFLAPYAFAWRHVIPALFVIGLFLGVLLWPTLIFRQIFLLTIGVYAAAAIWASFVQSLRYKDLRQIPALPFCFFAYHLSYGFGIILGWLRLLTGTSPVQKCREPWAGAGRPRATDSRKNCILGLTKLDGVKSSLNQKSQAAAVPSAVDMPGEVRKSISIIIPALNEEQHLLKCLSTVLEFRMPGGWAVAEILILDGGGQDLSLSHIKSNLQRYCPVKVVPNPRKIQSVAMNIGIMRAMGDFILRIDAHSTYDVDYLERCVAAWELTHAENIGGILATRPGGAGYGAKIVQAITTNKFGVGNSGFRTGSTRGYVDTVPFGFFNKNIFCKVGLFDERLLRAQDYEMNRRILTSGGRIWLSPDIRVTYHNQSSFSSFLKKQMLLEGPYNVYQWYLAPYAFAYRHAITGVFVLGLVFGGLLSHLPMFLEALLSVMTLYLLMAIFASVQQSIKYQDWRFVFILPLCFLGFHLSHGLGVVIGALKLAVGRSPVQSLPEPWPGAGQGRSWPPPNGMSWELNLCRRKI